MPKDKEMMKEVGVLTVFDRRGNIVGFWALDDVTRETILYKAHKVARGDMEDFFKEALAECPDKKPV